MEVVVTDTVGFIRHLPAELLKAFAATLEELQEADLLVHVIDLSNPAFREQIQVVEDLLRELELDEIPCLKVFNKMDREGVGEQLLACARQEGVIISALDALTFTPFLERAEQLMGKILKEFEMGRS
jgi:GTP-binding protein HflX